MKAGATKTTLEKLTEAESIIRKMKVMRQLQIKYFTDGRKPEVLNQSKIQERKVDQMIKEYFSQSQQVNCFNHVNHSRIIQTILPTLPR